MLDGGKKSCHLKWLIWLKKLINLTWTMTIFIQLDWHCLDQWARHSSAHRHTHKYTHAAHHWTHKYLINYYVSEREQFTKSAPTQIDWASLCYNFLVLARDISAYIVCTNTLGDRRFGLLAETTSSPKAKRDRKRRSIKSVWARRTIRHVRRNDGKYFVLS